LKQKIVEDLEEAKKASGREFQKNKD